MDIYWDLEDIEIDFDYFVDKYQSQGYMDLDLFDFDLEGYIVDYYR